MFLRKNVATGSLALVAALALMAGHAAFAQSSNDDQERQRTIASLGWIKSGNVALPTSSSTLSLPPDYTAVKSGDAQKLNDIINGDGEDPGLEAIVAGNDDSLIYLEYANDGYVTLDDWSSMDPDDLIKNVRQSTEEDNAQRVKRGISPLHVDDWVKKPTLDRQDNEVYWAYHLHDDQGNQIINAIAIQLGRNGYEKLTWAGDSDTFAKSTSLDEIMKARSFDKGSRYADHLDGDKVAGYGIAALVGTVIGAKVLKVAGFAAILLLLKKFIIAPFVIAALFFKKLWRKMFGRKQQDTAA